LLEISIVDVKGLYQKVFPMFLEKSGINEGIQEWIRPMVPMGLFATKLAG
jgi:hypothetical protein